MDLKELLLAKHSKAHTTKIAKWIGTDQKRFDQLVKFLMDGEEPLPQRAGWVLFYCAIPHPQLIQKHIGKLLKNLQRPNIHDAVKRNTIRILQDLPVPEKFQGDAMNICFDYITDPKEKPAIKAFSLTVLQNLAQQYPEIKNELKTVIESQWENESAAFRSRAKKILKTL
ncbi:MAG TPA: hypothetical protein VHM26_10850 [Chitinophagaceae bacterium]|jgi:hypothetical protein|nr:hypothetical protein [Chitinophagaceae bacterium]